MIRCIDVCSTVARRIGKWDKRGLAVPQLRTLRIACGSRLCAARSRAVHGHDYS